MGHERLGQLPHTERWRAVVTQLASPLTPPDDVAKIADDVLDNVETRFRRMHHDDGVVAAFQFLVVLAKSSAFEVPRAPTSTPTIDLDQDPTTLQLVRSLRSWVDNHARSQEYADLAKKAGADALAMWATQIAPQRTLFRDQASSREIWQRANNAAGFCRLSRFFFAKFTERYLNYFLCRDASAVSSDVTARDDLAQKLETHVDGVARYAFESSRITESFAAGWFSKFARDSWPHQDNLRAFLSIAFNKMREDLRRETSRQ